MPSDRSSYNKLQVLLDTARSYSVKTVDELIHHLEAKRHPAFMSRQYKPATDSFAFDVSKPTIKRVIRISQYLDLITVDGTLTADGKQSVGKGKFPLIVQRKLHNKLQSEGVDVTDLNKLIIKCLRGDPVTLPTARTLWQELGGKISYSKFSLILSLLAQSGGAVSTQRKLYLRVERMLH